MAIKSNFNTPEALYRAVTNSMAKTQKQIAAECGCSITAVSSILIEEKLRNRIARSKL